jgi:hypothetical protein
MATDSTWPIYRFGLLVTGKGERKHLLKLFRSLQATQLCKFKVDQRIKQRSPITSQRRQRGFKKLSLKGKGIPKDDEMLALRVRGYMINDQYDYVLLIDDLEYDQRPVAQEKFNRYREAIDYLLKDEQKSRVAVHFLVNMLEAYFFADANAINAVLGCNPPLEDHQGDVEEIRNPKRELKNLKKRCDVYSETQNAGEILEQLRVEHILSRPDACASLRTLFAWCVNKLEAHPQSDYFESLNLGQKFRLDNGRLWDVTRHQ